MNCDVIQDLMVLYADESCSAESRRLVEEHVKGCEACRRALAEMTAETAMPEAVRPVPAPRLGRIDQWRASLLQSALLFLSFGLLTFGVAREAATPAGDTNALWALAVIVPVTGFLLSLANWYFVRLYPSRRAFSRASLLAAAVFTLAGYAWAAGHYQGAVQNLWNGAAASRALLAGGAVLLAALWTLSGVLSDRYARLLGKE